MAEVTNDLIYEILKNIQGRMDKMEHDYGEIRHEVVSIRLTQMVSRTISITCTEFSPATTNVSTASRTVSNCVELAEARRPYDPT